MGEQPLLPCRIEEVEPALLLDALQARDQLEAEIQRLDDPDVVLGQVLAQPVDLGIGAQGRPFQSSVTSLPRRGIVIRRNGNVSLATPG